MYENEYKLMLQEQDMKNLIKISGELSGTIKKNEK